MSDLDTVFDDGTESAVVEDAGTVEPTEVEESAETGAETSAETEPVEAPPAKPDIAEDANAPRWARDAVVAERRKRQALEQRLAEVEAERSRHAQPAATEQPVVDDEFYANPVQFVERKVRAGVTQSRLAMSEAMVRAQYDDAEEAISAFVDAARANPALAAQMDAHPHPGLFAYQTGKTFSEVARYGGSLDEMRKALREEIRAELKAELAAPAAPKQKSLATARGAGSAKPSGRELSLDDVFTR